MTVLMSWPAKTRWPAPTTWVEPFPDEESNVTTGTFAG